MSAVRCAPVPALLRSLVVASLAVAAAVLPGAVTAGAAADEATTVTGRLVQAWPEAEAGDPHADGPISWVQNADGDAVRIPTDDVDGIPAGTTVQVTVDPQDDGSTPDPLTPVIDTKVLAPVATDPVLRTAAGITNQVTIVRVAPDGVAPDGVTLQQLVGLVDGPVADFWSEQSNGAIAVGVTGTHRDWVTPSAGCADPTAMWNEVAAAVGFVPGPGRHLMLYVSRAAANCAYALAEVGAAPATGGRLYVRDTTPSVVAHELGHNFGLGHSSERQCDGAVESGSCRTAAYRDYYDVMGVSWAQLGSLNAAQAARLGVLPAAQQTALTVRSSAATVTLAPLSGRSGTRALRLTDAEGVDYWLEYRTPTGRDAWLGTADDRHRLDSGVLLRRAGGLPDTSLLLDGTPTAAAGWDGDLQSALPVGSPVPVSGGDFTLVVRSVGAAGAVVAVTPTPPATAAAPAPRPATTVPGGVLPGADDAVGGAPAAGDSASLWLPSYEGSQALAAAPALRSAADDSSRLGLLVPLTVAAGLAATALLLARTLRRSAARRR